MWSSSFPECNDLGRCLPQAAEHLAGQKPHLLKQEAEAPHSASRLSPLDPQVQAGGPFWRRRLKSSPIYGPPREKPNMSWTARTPQPRTPVNLRGEARLPQAAEEVAGRGPHVLAREADLRARRHGHGLRPRVQRVADDALPQLQAALALRAFPRHAQHSTARPSHHRSLAYHAPQVRYLLLCSA